MSVAVCDWLPITKLAVEREPRINETRLREEHLLSLLKQENFTEYLLHDLPRHRPFISDDIHDFVRAQELSLTNVVVTMLSGQTVAGRATASRPKR